MVLKMFRSSKVSLISVCMLAVLSGCGTSQLEMSRSAAAIQLPHPAAISALSRKFRAETPYIVNFDFDLDELDAEATAKLDIQAAWILEHSNVKFRVYGHADKVGNPVYNLDLGLRRAQRVVDYLISTGIDESRLEAMVSFGEDAPLVATENRERANRRALTDVIGFVAPVPGEGIAASPDVVSELVIDDVPPTEPDAPQGGTVPSPNPTPGPSPDPDPTPDSSPQPDPGPQPTGKPNSGRGNGDDGGDPGKSGGKNKGGDEVG